MVIGLFGCSDSNNNSQSIVGVWESQNCVQEDDQEGYVMTNYEFNSDNTFHQETKRYYNQDCSSYDFWTFHTLDGTYTIGEKDVAASGESVTRINLTIPCPNDAIDCSPEIFNYVYYIKDDTLIFGEIDGGSDEYALFHENIYFKID